MSNSRTAIMPCWGKRSGGMARMPGDSAPSLIVRGKRATSARHEHQGPHGTQLRWYAARAVSRRLGKHGMKQQATRNNQPRAAT